MSRKLSRRTFLGQLGGVTAASLAARVAGVPLLGSLNPTAVDAAEMAPTAVQDRRWQAYRLRQNAALAQSDLPLPHYPTNPDYS